MTDLKGFLEEKGVDKSLISVLGSIAESCILISRAIQTADTGKAGSTNVYGEQQMALDILSDRILADTLGKNFEVGLLASEEMDGEKRISEGKYAVCYDPLDGSSLIDVNLSVGTIFGVYETATLVGVCGQEMKAAGFCVYGPRTTMVLSCGDGVMEFVFKEGTFLLSKENLSISEGKMFAPGNLRVCKERADYLELVEYWIKEEYTLRYSGGMVPDVNQILLKGKGIFTYPGAASQPEGKLRLLFECAPLAYVVEQAGGAASDGFQRILEKKAERIDMRSPILIGSRGEVERAVRALRLEIGH